MKKTLSLILAIILTFSMATFAFAGETATALTKDEAKSIALKYLDYSDEASLILNTTYNGHDVYNITSTLLLKSGRYIIFTTIVDEYTGKIYDQKADFKGLSMIFTKNITMEKAFDLAIEAFDVNKDNTVVITQEAIVTESGEDAYHFIFSEGNSLKYECTVMKYDGSIENITIKESQSIIERIILAIRAFLSKLSISNLLEKISASDLLEFFQFLAK